jgi:hypothetical protein
MQDVVRNFEAYIEKSREATKATQEFNAEAERMRGEMEKFPTLYGKVTTNLGRLTEENATAAQITRILGADIDTLYANLDELSPEMQEVVKNLKEYIDATRKAEVESKKYENAVKDSKEEIEAMRNRIPDLVDEMKAFREAGGSDVEMLEKFADRIISAVEEAKTFGYAIDENVLALYKHIKAIREDEKMAKEFEEAWNHATGEVLGYFINSIETMSFSWRGFADMLVNTVKNLGKTLLKTFISNVFKPILQAGQSFMQQLGKTIGNLIFGGGGGGGGFLSKIPGLGGPGLLSKIPGVGDLLTKLGLGTAATAATTATAAAGTAATAAGAGAFTAMPAATAPGVLAPVGGGGFGMGSLGAFFTNPWTIGIGAALAGFFAIKKWWPKSSFEKMANETGRDFGISVSKSVVENFAAGKGISKKMMEDIRKDISSSPEFFKNVLLPQAQAQGPGGVEALIARFGQLEAFGQKFDLSAGAAQAALEGNYDLLNKQFVEVFGRMHELQEVLPDWKDKLLVVTETTEAVTEAQKEATKDLELHKSAVAEFTKIMEDGKFDVLEMLDAGDKAKEGNLAFAAILDALKEAGGDLEKAMQILAEKLKEAEVAAEVTGDGTAGAPGTDTAASTRAVIRRGGGATQAVDLNKPIGLMSGYYAEAARWNQEKGSWPTFQDFINAGKIETMHSGGYVKQTGLKFLERGEFVLPKQEPKQTIVRNEITISPRIEVKSRSEDLARTVRNEVVPELIAMMKTNARGFAEEITRTNERTRRGVRHN